MHIAGRQVISCVLLLGIPLLNWLMYVWWDGDNGVLISLLASLILALMAMAFWRVREAGILQPLFPLLISVGVGFIGKIIYMALEYGSNPIVDDDLLLGGGLDGMLSGALVISISMAVLLVFYMLPRMSSVQRPVVIEHYFSASVVKVLGVLILSLGVTFFVLYVAIYSGGGELTAKRFAAEGALPSDRFTDVGYYLFKAAFVVKTAFYIFLLVYLSAVSRRQRITALLLVMGSLFMSMVVSFYFSNRGSLFVLLLDAGVILYVLRARISSLLVFPLLVVILGVIMTASEMRSEVAESKGTMDHVFGGRYFFELSKNAHIYDYLSSGGDLRESDVIVSDDPLHTYLNLGRAAGSEIFNLPSSGVPLGLPAELFALGGWMVLIFGMGILGLFLRKWTLLVARPVIADFMAVVYAMVATRFGIFLFNNGLGVAIYQVSIDLVPFIIVVAVARALAAEQPRRTVYFSGGN